MTMPAFADLELRILERQLQGYPVELRLDGEQEFARGFLAPTVPTLDPDDDPQAIGEALFAWLLADKRLASAWAEIRGRRPNRRIRLRIDAEAPELHALPWETLRDPGDGAIAQVLAASTSTPFSRYLALPFAPPAPLAERSLKVLVAIAGPGDLADYGLDPVDVEQEQASLAAAFAAKPVALTVLPQPCTLQAIEAALRDGCHVLHVVAHGIYDDGEARAMLVLADEHNRARFVPDAEIAEMLRRVLGDGAQAPLRLIFLDSCETATRSPADAFRGLAPQLVAAGVPAVVAMQEPVAVATGRAFAATFYRRLLEHGLVDLAANEARSEVIAAWLPGPVVPVIFMRLRDGLLGKNNTRESQTSQVMPGSSGRWIDEEIEYRAVVIRAYDELTFAGIEDPKIKLTDMGLDRVFVRLALSPHNEETPRTYELTSNPTLSIAKEGVRNRLRLFGRRKSSQQQEWLDKRTVARTSRTGDKDGHGVSSKSRSVGLEQVLGDQALILGEPGAGKSTLFRWLAVVFAEGGQQEPDRIGPGAEVDRIPVYLELARLVEFCEQTRKRTVIDWLSDLPTFVSSQLAFRNISAEFVRKILESGRCLLLCDGLDEVIDRGIRIDMMQSLAELARLTGTRVIVGSRPSGIAGREHVLAAKFRVFDVERFTPQDVEKFIHTWYELEGVPATQDQSLQPEMMWEAVKADDRVLELARTPLLSAILVRIWSRLGRLPNRRVELYEECCRILIGQWEEEHRVRHVGIMERIDWQKHLQLLAPLAYDAHKRGEIGCSRQEGIRILSQTLQNEGFCATPISAKLEAENLLNLLSLRSGLMQHRGVDRYEFLHLTFQEYLTARYIAAQPNPEYVDLFMEHLHEEWWQEVHVLTIGHLGSHRETAKRASVLVMNVLDCYREPWPRFLRPFSIPYFLRFGGWQYRIGLWELFLISKVLTMSLPFISLGVLLFMWAVALSKGVAGNQDRDALVQFFQAISMFLTTAITNLASVTTEFFGLSLRETLNGLLVLTLVGTIPFWYCGLAISVSSLFGKWQLGRSLAWLLCREFDLADRAVRACDPAFVGLARSALLDRAQLLLKIHLYEPARSDLAPTQFDSILESLRQANHETTRMVLEEALDNELSAIQEKAAAALIQWEQTGDDLLRRSTERALDSRLRLTTRTGALITLMEVGKKAGTFDAILSVLNEAMKKGKPPVQTTIAGVIGDYRTWGPDAKEILLNGLEAKAWQTRWNSLLSITELQVQDEDLVEACNEALSDRESLIRRAAIAAVIAVDHRHEMVADALLKKTEDKNYGVARSAAWGLGQLGITDERVVARLTDMSVNENKFPGIIGLDAALSLGRLSRNDSQVRHRIVEMSQDTRAVVRQRAAMALGEVMEMDEETLGSLMTLIDDSAPKVRVTAAASLIHCKKEVQRAVQTISDNIGYVTMPYTISFCIERLAEASDQEENAERILLNFLRMRARLTICMRTLQSLVKTLLRAVIGLSAIVMTRRNENPRELLADFGNAIMSDIACCVDGGIWVVFGGDPLWLEEPAIVSLGQLNRIDGQSAEIIRKKLDNRSYGVRMAAARSLGTAAIEREDQLNQVLANLVAAMTGRALDFRAQAIGSISQLVKKQPLPGYSWEPIHERRLRYLRWRQASFWMFLAALATMIGAGTMWFLGDFVGSGFEASLLMIPCSLLTLGALLARVWGNRLQYPWEAQEEKPDET